MDPMFDDDGCSDLFTDLCLPPNWLGIGSVDDLFAGLVKKHKSRSIYNLHPSQGNSMTTGCPKISQKCNNNNMEKIGDSSSTTKDLLESPNVD